MTETVAPKPEFLSLTEQAVLAAPDHQDPANPIVIEVARLVTACTNNLRSHVERLGYIPVDILRVKPRWPIEAVAQRLTTKAISETLAQPVSADKIVYSKNSSTSGMRVKAILLPEKDLPCDGVMPMRMLSRPKR